MLRWVIRALLCGQSILEVSHSQHRVGAAENEEEMPSKTASDTAISDAQAGLRAAGAQDDWAVMSDDYLKNMIVDLRAEINRVRSLKGKKQHRRC